MNAILWISDHHFQHSVNFNVHNAVILIAVGNHYTSLQQPIDYNDT